MSTRDPFPPVKLENDFTFSGFKPQQKKICDKPTHIAQTEEPWSHLHDTATKSSTRRSVMYQEHEVPKDSLDFHLNTVYNHHQDCFWNKNKVLYQKENIPEDQGNSEKQNNLANKWENETRVWVDPQRRSIHSIK